MSSEAQRRATAKYNKSNIKSIGLKLNRNTEKELIEFLELKKSPARYLKELILKDMEQNK